MEKTTGNIVRRQELLEAIETYNHVQDESLLEGIFRQIRRYLEQADLRRQELKRVFCVETTLDQALAALEQLPSETEYYLMGCYLLAQSRQRHWDASEILTAMKINCNGCISWLSEEEKDFLGRIALHQASSFLTKEQLIQVIQLLDGYYLRQDVLNRIAERDEPETIAILRKRLVGEMPASVQEKQSDTYRNIDDAKAFILFEDMMTSPLNEDISEILNKPSPFLINNEDMEPASFADVKQNAELLELFALIKMEGLKSGKAITHLLERIVKRYGGNFAEYENAEEFENIAETIMCSQYPELLFLSFIEYDIKYFKNWYDEAWKVLDCLGKSSASLDFDYVFDDDEGESNIPFADRWYNINSNADERIARLECYLVKLLEMTILHGTSMQVAQILSFLTPGAIARHAAKLAALDIPVLYSILKENGFSYFALHKIIAALNLNKLPFRAWATIAPCMLDDKMFLAHFLNAMS